MYEKTWADSLLSDLEVVNFDEARTAWIDPLFGNTD